MANKKLRAINTHFWDDPYIMDLDPIEKLTYAYLFTNSLCNLVGIYEIAIKRVAFDTGIDRDMVLRLFERFEKDGKIKYIDGFIIIHNFMKNQNYNANMMKGAKHIFEQLPETIRNHSKGFQTVGKVEYEVEVEDEVEYEEGSKEGLPTLSQVKSVFKELNKELDAEKFYNYYEANNWVTKAGQPIKNWRAAIRNWIKRDKNTGNITKQETDNRSSYEQAVSKEISSIFIPEVLQIFTSKTYRESEYKKLPKDAQKRITDLINNQKKYCHD